ncbi:lysozyme [Cupriavidus gilardii CR3]|uniref:Lysozyme n=1 Tax=Cupriavidus gilardii TaxID=82541 RepID=A0A849BCI0_9BURK|nr:lysozyme [Cupriavidus gilardii]ALD93454.1 lysozyme [Cupriavidus gilardii CR3]KAB0599166.1 lysozyme [Cupriavidus gilardii]MCT9017175.1 lysozyme [Cupriavidus gilardii]NNH13112.1 lysozyme [Cupriavidus gilardii]
MNSDLRTRLIAAGIAAAVPLVAAFEGLRQTAYLDPVGIPTACFGATKGVRLGQVYTREQCDDLLAKDLLEANAGVNSCVRVPLSEGQRTALVSFAYNVGRGKFCGSTLVRKLNAGDYVGACNELPRWVYAKGVKLPGLVNRRAQERALCLG